MGNLSNLYISQSFISLIHLASNNTASTTLTELEDGLGNGLGVYVNTEGDLSFGGVFYAHKGAEISGSLKINTETTQSTIPYLNVNTNNIVVPGNVIRIDGPSGSAGQTPPTISDVVAGWKVIGDGIPTPTYVLSVTHSLNRTDIEISSATAYYSSSYYFTEPATFPNVSLSGSMDITGSLWVRDKITATNISASNSISASNLWVKGRISAYELDVTIESSSIIFTSGSNIIGDNANEDTQTLIGRVKVSGSLEVTSSIKATSDISSSTISGIGNVTSYSASVFSQSVFVSSSLSNRIEINSSSFNSFSASQYKPDSSSFDSRIDSLEAFSSSIQTNFATQAELNLSSSQLQANINTKLDTASFNSWTNSVYIPFSTSVDSRLDLIESKYATTGSNTFVGNQIITGSLIISSSADIDLSVIGKSVYTGSVRGNVTSVSITSNTASIDCSLGNFFTLSVPSGSTTRLAATNVLAGQTIQLRITQPSSGFGLVSYDSNIKFSQYFPYQSTPISNAIDVISFATFDTTNLYAVAVNNF